MKSPFLAQIKAIILLICGMCISIFILNNQSNNNINNNHNNNHYAKNANKMTDISSPHRSIRTASSITADRKITSSSFGYPPQVHGKAPRLLIGILSSADNFKRRRIIRKTWLQIGANLNWEPWFIVGKSKTAKHQKKVMKEAQNHRDMIIFDHIVEDYYTISEKVEAFFTWALHAWGGHNNHPQFFMKTDDDCVIEIPMLFEALKHLPSHKLYMGRPRENSKVIRPDGKRANEKYAQKWTVTKDEYDKDYFPTYMGGPGYILSYDIVQQMVIKIKKRNKKKKKPFKFEDVNVGILLDGVDYDMHGKRSFFLEPTKYDRKWIGSTHTFVHHRVTEVEMGQFAMEKKLNPELPWRRSGEIGHGGDNINSEIDSGGDTVAINKRIKQFEKEEQLGINWDHLNLRGGGGNNKQKTNKKDNEKTEEDVEEEAEENDVDDSKDDGEEEGKEEKEDEEDFTVPLLNKDILEQTKKDKDLFRDEDNSGNKKSYFKHYSFNPPPKAS